MTYLITCDAYAPQIFETYIYRVCRAPSCKMLVKIFGSARMMIIRANDAIYEELSAEIQNNEFTIEPYEPIDTF